MNAPDRMLPVPPPPARPRISLHRLVLIAMRELRAGLNGFYVFIACIALGVAVITTVGALSDALHTGFERQGQTILGGDVTFARMHQRASEAERRWLAAQGRFSETATMRAMARRLDGEEQALIEIKAVDAAYPLAGALPVEEGLAFDAAVSGSPGAAVDPILLERLGLKLGDKMRIGDAMVTVTAKIGDEPDAIADRLTYGPRVFLSLETLQATGLIQPGTLVRWRYALNLPEEKGADPAALLRIRQRAKAELPEAGFSVADRRDPSPQLSKTLERLRQFLTFLGLTALLVGGVGVASAVSTFIERRRNVIATMKSLGAPSRLVFSIFLIEVMAIALIGVLIGLAIGLSAPWLLTLLYGDALPIKAALSFSPRSILTGAAYGFFVALLFTLWPLGRAELIRPSVLFRDEVAPEAIWPKPRIIFATVLVACALLSFAVLMAESQRIALYFCGGLVLVFAIFAGLGALVTRVARRAPRFRLPELRLAIANLGAPGGLTQSVVLSLGAGLSLLVAVALTDNSLVSELRSRLPQTSPNYFVLDIPKADYAGLEELVRKEVPGATVVDAPMLRGRLVSLKGLNVELMRVPPEAQWVLNGDRGLTFADKVPEGSVLVKGEWWSETYEGEPLVSFESELARHLGVDIGDQVTVNVLGRNLTARIANLREVKWESLNLNFVMVFSPNALRAAPYTMLATVALPKGIGLNKEAQVARAVGKAYPMVTVIRVKDALDAFNRVFTKVMVAVRAAGSITLLSGALVLAGALATAQRRRILEAVILKVLGATRRRILVSHLIEYVMLAALAALFAVALGTLASWLAVSQVMRIPFTFSTWAVVQALLVATVLVAVFGLLGTWAVLRARPVPYLRAE
ncbi:MAG: FtsX-like permease family protein [Hyphomicrobium sp.]|jgi:putative ABC transport system permease protein